MNNRLLIIMQDTALRKAFGTRVKKLRKQKHWTQKELAAKVDIRYQLLNKYESGQHIPPASTLINLADALDTTIDYLLTGNPIESSPLSNTFLFKRFKEIESFNKEEQDTVITLIDAMIAKHRMESAMKPV
ncbi:MAG: helix-turn-helix domain-containing protein [Gammaproteobacteria bacterium]|nr:helix-turn-helix domain-containing protein [Gammaproteobacteria bacterium]